MMAAYHLAKRSGVDCARQGSVAGNVYLDGGTPEAVAASWVLSGVSDADIKSALGGDVFRIVEDYRADKNTQEVELIRKHNK